MENICFMISKDWVFNGCSVYMSQSMCLDRQEFKVLPQSLQIQQFIPPFESRGLTHSSEKGYKP